MQNHQCSSLIFPSFYLICRVLWRFAPPRKKVVVLGPTRDAVANVHRMSEVVGQAYKCADKETRKWLMWRLHVLVPWASGDEDVTRTTASLPWLG